MTNFSRFFHCKRLIFGFTTVLIALATCLSACEPISGLFVGLSNTNPPDVADYSIEAHLDVDSHILVGNETITYLNTTEKPITDLVFHLYMNAFKSVDTIFMRESGGQLNGASFDANHNGWIDVNDLRLANGTSLPLKPLEDGTLASANLPEPVGPGQRISIQVLFREQFPKAFARTGWAKDANGSLFYLGGQWFPKLGVWTEKGWNAYPYHGNSEFFSDFGNYNVRLTIPSNYQTGGSGNSDKTTKNGDGSQTVSYNATGVIDFAWVASPDLQQFVSQVGTTQVQYLYLPEHSWSVDRIMDGVTSALKQFGTWYYPYPYTHLTVVDVPEDGLGAGAMEYPSFITAALFSETEEAPPSNPWSDYAEYTIMHEVGHQWFQSTIATNEAEEPWLDEGLTDYSALRLMITRFGLDGKSLNQGDFPPGILQDIRQAYLKTPGVTMGKKAWDYFNFNLYTVAAYWKPDLALLTLQRELGDSTMENLLRTYALKYRFAHPTTADFKQVAINISGQPLEWFFGDPLKKTGLVYGDAILDFTAESINGETITVDRFGDEIIPVDILVTFVDGSQQTLVWDAKDEKHTFQFNTISPVKSFSLDPQHKLLIEYDWKNNLNP